MCSSTFRRRDWGPLRSVCDSAELWLSHSPEKVKFNPWARYTCGRFDLRRTMFCDFGLSCAPASSSLIWFSHFPLADWSLDSFIRGHAKHTPQIELLGTDYSGPGVKYWPKVRMGRFSGSKIPIFCVKWPKFEPLSIMKNSFLSKSKIFERNYNLYDVQNDHHNCHNFSRKF